MDTISRGASSCPPSDERAAPARRTVWADVDQSAAATGEAVAGPLVWGGAGWLLDTWLGTDPWLLIVGVLGGFAGGMYLVWLRAGRLRGHHDHDEEQPAPVETGA